MVCNSIQFKFQDLNDRLGDQEDRNADLQRAKKKLESELDSLKKQIQDLEMSLRKSESEKQSKDHQIRSLQDEMAAQVSVTLVFVGPFHDSFQCSKFTVLSLLL